MYPYHDVQALCDAYNAELAAKGRDDVRWFPGNDGRPFIAETYEYTARKTKWLVARLERDVKRFAQGQANAG